MRTPWWIYLIVGLIGGLAGIAIAGLPDGTPVTETIVVPPSTTTTTTPTTTTSTTTTAPTTTASTTSTQPDTTVDTTTPPATGSGAAASSVDTAEASGGQPLVAEANLFVIVANGADVAGLAARTMEALQGIGYVDAAATDGTEIVDATIVYFNDGLEREAARLALGMGLLPAATAALIDAPDIEGTAPSGPVLVVYLGRDYGS